MPLQELSTVREPSQTFSRRQLSRSLAGSLALIAASRIGSPVSRASDYTTWRSEFTVDNFRIHSDITFDSSHDLTQELRQIRNDIVSVLRLQPSKAPVHIVLFGTESEFVRYMSNYFPHIPSRRAIYMQDRGPGMLFGYFHEEVSVDLRHEVVHALLNDGAHALPMWLDEGLAEYFEVPKKDRFRGGQKLAATVQKVQNGRVPDLRSLSTIERLEDFDDARYQDSWSWIHYMLHRRNATRSLLIRYLADHRSGARPAPLVRQLADSGKKLGDDYTQHFLSLAAHNGTRLAGWQPDS